MKGRLWLCLPLLAFVLLALLLARGLGRDPQTLPTALAGQPFPTFRLPATHDGRPLTERDLAGPALVNVWATWCPTCQREHAFLMELAAQGVPIYGVNYKDDLAAARRWLRERHDPYRLDVHDAAGTLGIDLGVYGAPETFLIDAAGRIRHRHVGALDERVWQRDLEPRYQALREVR